MAEKANSERNNLDEDEKEEEEGMNEELNK